MLQVLRRLIIPDQVIILENRPPGDAMSVTTDTGETLLIKRETENGIVHSLICFYIYIQKCITCTNKGQCIFSSPEHKVLRVSYCDRPFFRRPSCVMRRP